MEVPGRDERLVEPVALEQDVDNVGRVLGPLHVGGRCDSCVEQALERRVRLVEPGPSDERDDKLDRLANAHELAHDLGRLANTPRVVWAAEGGPGAALGPLDGLAVGHDWLEHVEEATDELDALARPHLARRLRLVLNLDRPRDALEHGRRNLAAGVEQSLGVLGAHDARQLEDVGLEEGRLERLRA